MNRAELIKKLESQKKVQDQTGYWLLSFLVLFGLLFAWLSRHEDVFPESIRPLVLLVILFGGLYGTLIAFGIRAKKQRGKLGLCCPQCKKCFIGISAQIVLASGRCGRCGQIILEDWNK